MYRIRLFFKDSRTLTFLVCLLLSLFLWTPMRLSKNLIREVSVPVIISHPPADKVIVPPFDYSVKLQIEGNGFSLLKAYSQNPILPLDFADLQEVGESRYCLSKSSKVKLSNTYFSNFRIRGVVSDTLQVYLAAKHTKKVPVEVQLNVEYPKEYQLTELRITPDSVLASGCAQVIDTLSQVRFQYSQKRVARDNFGKVFTLKNTPYVQYNERHIKVEAFVDKVSEQVLKIPIQVIGVPKNSQVKIFPNEVSVLCRGELNILKTLTTDDILITANLAEANGGTTLPLHLSTRKKRLKVAFFAEDSVDFLIRNE